MCRNARVRAIGRRKRLPTIGWLGEEPGQNVERRPIQLLSVWIASTSRIEACRVA